MELAEVNPSYQVPAESSAQKASDASLTLSGGRGDNEEKNYDQGEQERPKPIRYTRSGQLVPEGKVILLKGGCVGESDWKRTNGAIQSMFEPLHHVLTDSGGIPPVLPSNGFWLRAMTDQAVLELCKAYDIEPDPDGDARKNRAAFLNYLGATYLAAVV